MASIAEIKRSNTIASMSGVKAGEHGPCPICAVNGEPASKERNRDRLHNLGPRWTCRGCRRAGRRGGGDVVDMLAALQGLTVAELVRQTGGGDVPVDLSGAAHRAWRACHERMVDALDSDDPPGVILDALECLAMRGFTTETVEQAGLGWSDGETREGFDIPRGLVIPICSRRGLVGLEAWNPWADKLSVIWEDPAQRHTGRHGHVLAGHVGPGLGMEIRKPGGDDAA